MPCSVCGKDLGRRKSKKCRGCLETKNAVVNAWSKSTRGGGVSACLICGFVTTISTFKMLGNEIFCCGKCFKYCEEMGREKYLAHVSDEKNAEEILSKTCVVGVNNIGAGKKIAEALLVVVCRHDWDTVKSMKNVVVVPYEINEHGVSYRTYDLVDWGDRTDNPEEIYQTLEFDNRKTGKKTKPIRGGDLLARAFCPPHP